MGSALDGLHFDEHFFSLLFFPVGPLPFLGLLMRFVVTMEDGSGGANIKFNSWPIYVAYSEVESRRESEGGLMKYLHDFGII